MNVLRCMAQWRELRTSLTGRIGFVPTMGALHQGHLSLLQASTADNDLTVLSIYVNATQFNDPNDFAKYPNALEDDLALAEAAGVDVVLLPDYEQMYADGFRYRVTENEFSNQ